MDFQALLMKTALKPVPTIVEHLLNNSESEGLGVEQAISIGILKNHTGIFPELELDETTEEFAKDFESLRLSGFNNEKAHSLVSFIYLPRITLVKGEYLDMHVVQKMDDEIITDIVYDALSNHLQEHAISVEDDLEFNVGGLEGGSWEDFIDV